MNNHTLVFTPVLQSRLKPPPCAEIELERAAIQERLCAAIEANRAVLLVTAPAGYGKTVVLRRLQSILLAEGQATPWLSLDAQLNTPACFHSHLTAALAAAGLELPDTTSLAELQIEICNLADRSTQAVTLFLDQVEALNHCQLIDFLDALLGNAAAALRVVIASRRALPIRTGGLMAAGRLTRLGVDELAFSFAEAGEFLLRAVPEPLGVARLNLAYELSQGWPGVLTILSRDKALRGGFSGGLSTGQGSHAEIDAYIEQEILAGLDDRDRSIMDVLSLAEDADAALVDDILGKPARLSRVAARNPLIQPGREAGRYRLHPLIRTCLRAQLFESDHERYASYCREFGSRLRKAGDAAGAIDYLIDSGDLDSAVDLLENEGRRMALNGFPDRCLKWLARLPGERFVNHPGLMLADAWARMATHDIDTALQRLEQAAAFVSTIDEPAFAPEVELARALAVAIADRPHETQAIVDRLLQEGPALSAGILAGRACAMAWLAYCRGDFERGLRELFQGSVLTETDHGLLFQAYASVVAAECYTGQGLIDSAEAECRRSLKLVERMRGRGSVLTGTILGPLIDVLYETDRLDEALALCAGRMDHVLHYPTPGVTIAGAVWLARALFLKGAAREADELMERMTRIGEHRRIPRLTAQALSTRIRFALDERRTATVPTLLGQVEAICDSNQMPERPGFVVDYLPRLTRLHVRIAAGELQPLLDDVQSFRQEVGLSPWVRLHMQISALHAALLWRCSEHEAAISTLAGTIARSAPLGLARSLTDELQLAPALLSSPGLAAAVAPQHQEYLRRLIAIVQGDMQADTVDTLPLSTEKDEELSADESGFTAREREILYLIARGLAAKHIARTLGISPQTARWHLKNIYQKLGVHSKASAIAAIRRLHANAR